MDEIDKPVKEKKKKRLKAENELLRLENKMLRQRIEDLERLADTDTLTPLANRRVFTREIERRTRQFERYGTPAVVMFVDVDGLKEINDVHGHLCGDAALIHTARVLQRNLRATDTVARIGGDEFGLVLDYLSEAEGRAKGENLLASLKRTPLRHGAVEIPLSLSIGVTPVSEGDTVDMILARADAAMYRLKTGSRGGVGPSAPPSRTDHLVLEPHRADRRVAAPSAVRD